MTSKQFAIIGMGRFGRAMALELTRMGHEVLAIDSNESYLEQIKNNVTHAIQADVTDEADIENLGLRNFDVVVVAIGEDIKASILCCMLCKDAGVPKVVAKVGDALHAKILRNIGVDMVVFPEADMGTRMAHTLASTNALVLDHVDLSDKYSMNNMYVPAEWVDKSIGDLNLRAKYGINIVAVRTGDDVIINPDPKRKFQNGDLMIIIAECNSMAKLEGKFQN